MSREDLASSTAIAYQSSRFEMESFLSICLKRLDTQKTALIEELSMIDHKANQELVTAIHDRLAETIELLRSAAIGTKLDEDDAAEEHVSSMARIMQKTAERIGDSKLLEEITTEYSDLCRREVRSSREALAYLDRVNIDLIQDFFRRVIGVYLERNYRQDTIHTRRAEIKLEHSIKCFEAIKRHEIDSTRQKVDAASDAEAESIIEEWITLMKEHTDILMKHTDSWITTYRIHVLQVNKEILDSAHVMELGNPISALT